MGLQQVMEASSEGVAAIEEYYACAPGAGSNPASTSVAPAVIALHPTSRFVVVSIGAGFRIFDLRDNVVVVCQDESIPSLHWDAIRAIAFSRDGKLFASAGDDKLVKLWDATSWHCLKTIRLSKKVNAVCFSHDGSWLMFADKFGVVYVVPTAANQGNSPGPPAQLLAHCCSIITGLESSRDGAFVVTSDRDFKIRVTSFPENPLAGAHEIHSYCLGHTNFVSCIAFVGDQHAGPEYLVSGGGDGTIRLWQLESGGLMDVFHVAAESGRQADNGSLNIGEENVDPAVLSIAVCFGDSVVAATVQRLCGVILLKYHLEVGTLSYLQIVRLSDGICPTSLAFDNEDRRLWVVSGAAATVETGDEVLSPEAVAAVEARGRAIAAAATLRLYVLGNAAGEDGDSGKKYSVIEEEFVPGGSSLLDALQGRRTGVAEAALAAQAAELALSNLLTKRQYSAEQRDHRKRLRNDRKTHRPKSRK